MPSEAKPGDKRAAAAGPKVGVDSCDFYRDVDGDGKFNAEADQFLAADNNGGDGFTDRGFDGRFPAGTAKLLRRASRQARQRIRRDAGGIAWRRPTP